MLQYKGMGGIDEAAQTNEDPNPWGTPSFISSYICKLTILSPTGVDWIHHDTLHLIDDWLVDSRSR